MVEQYQKLVMNKKLTLLELAREMSNISKACKIMGYSRQQYYNIKQRFSSARHLAVRIKNEINTINSAGWTIKKSRIIKGQNLFMISNKGE